MMGLAATDGAYMLDVCSMFGCEAPSKVVGYADDGVVGLEGDFAVVPSTYSR